MDRKALKAEIRRVSNELPPRWYKHLCSVIQNTRSTPENLQIVLGMQRQAQLVERLRVAIVQYMLTMLELLRPQDLSREMNLRSRTFVATPRQHLDRSTCTRFLSSITYRLVGENCSSESCYYLEHLHSWEQLAIKIAEHESLRQEDGMPMRSLMTFLYGGHVYVVVVDHMHGYCGIYDTAGLAANHDIQERFKEVVEPVVGLPIRGSIILHQHNYIQAARAGVLSGGSLGFCGYGAWFLCALAKQLQATAIDMPTILLALEEAFQTVTVGYAMPMSDVVECALVQPARATVPGFLDFGYIQQVRSQARRGDEFLNQWKEAMRDIGIAMEGGNQG